MLLGHKPLQMTTVLHEENSSSSNKYCGYVVVRKALVSCAVLFSGGGA